MTTDRLEDLGDRVLYLGEFRGKGRESGIETSVEAAAIMTIKDDLVVDMRSFVAWAEALEAAGLSE
jgi:hypothetical protein